MDLHNFLSVAFRYSPLWAWILLILEIEYFSWRDKKSGGRVLRWFYIPAGLAFMVVFHVLFWVTYPPPPFEQKIPSPQYHLTISPPEGM